MADPVSRSDRSGALLDPDALTTMTYVFEDGARRAVEVSVAEAEALRQQGEARTTRWQRLRPSVTPGLKRAAGFLVAALIGGLIAQEIGDRYADRQAELDLEAGLITTISADSTKLYQRAQDAARAVGDPAQRAKRDKAADEWVLSSGSVTPVFRTYYDGTSASAHWDAFQAAMYDWAVLGCCTTDAGRAELIARIHSYVDEHVASEPAHGFSDDPWAALDVAQPPGEAYQWLGRYLLRGRGAILKDLKATDADLD